MPPWRPGFARQSESDDAQIERIRSYPVWRAELPQAPCKWSAADLLPGPESDAEPAETAEWHWRWLCYQAAGGDAAQAGHIYNTATALQAWQMLTLRRVEAAMNQ